MPTIRCFPLTASLRVNRGAGVLNRLGSGWVSEAEGESIPLTGFDFGAAGAADAVADPTHTAASNIDITTASTRTSPLPGPPTTAKFNLDSEVQCCVLMASIEAAAASPMPIECANRRALAG